jgi:hypothetical protein
MTEFLDLVPFARPPQWGAWEPLALTMILAGGAALMAAGLAVWRAASWTYLFALTACCALACGLLGVFVPLEQPLRVWEFAVHPAFTSWTAWGACILPLAVCCALALLWLHRGRGVAPRLCGLAGLVLGALVLAYATGELRACVGRPLWSALWATPVLLAGGAAAAAGLALLLALRLWPLLGRWSAVPEGLHRAGLLLLPLCALLALLLRAPQGFAPFAGPWWHGPEILIVLLGLAGLLLHSAGRGGAAAWGLAVWLSGVLLLWKVVHLGEIFGRNAALYPARAAVLDLLGLDALLAFAGTAGLAVLLAVLLPRLLPPAATLEG